MYCVKKVSDDYYWIGGSDRRLALFENAFPIPRGISYNAYVLLDEKTVLLDMVDKSISSLFFENLEHVLGGRPLDYVIVNHVECDHCAALEALLRRHPETRLVTNAKALAMIGQFFTFNAAERAIVVKEGDTLSAGHHTLSFVMAPMVHWPEVMLTYDQTAKTLFSADAFGTFGALGGHLFADELDFAGEWLPDARRYYANIVGKYGAQVQALLGKMDALPVELICPLHGPLWRKDISWFVEKYRQWSAYEPEEEGVLIAYASIYGGTENAANILAMKLAEAGVKNVRVYDVSVTHSSVIVAEAFRLSHFVFAAPTYNGGLFPAMEALLLDLAAHNVRHRTIALMENGSWAPMSGKLMAGLLGGLKDCTLLSETVRLKSALKADQLESIDALAGALAATMATPLPAAAQAESSALFKLSYGLFVLTVKEGEKDNGCIINTAIQLTSDPKRISIAVNKANYTHDMIVRTGVFNVSVLTTEAPFDLFKYYGFQSGHDVNKFEGSVMPRGENGLIYLNGFANAFISGRVIQMVDCGTHTLFIADVSEARALSKVASATYAYYFDHIKPKQAASPRKKGFVCKICGYVYEGDTLPADFICPICKHGAEDFEPLK